VNRLMAMRERIGSFPKGNLGKWINHNLKDTFYFLFSFHLKYFICFFTHNTVIS
jgi:hypothetical protein